MEERRFIVIGSTCAGKSTLAQSLAQRLRLEYIDLDALHWLPDWQARPKQEFREAVVEAIRGERWVLAGNYSIQQDISWSKADTVVWLDLPLWVIVKRVVRRTFTRWRTRELLWGTNRERFFSLFAVWDEEQSLLAWAVRHHWSRRRSFATAMVDERWTHLRFLRFRSTEEAQSWLSSIPNGAGIDPERLNKQSK